MLPAKFGSKNCAFPEPNGIGPQKSLFSSLGLVRESQFTYTPLGWKCFAAFFISYSNICTNNQPNVFTKLCCFTVISSHDG